MASEFAAIPVRSNADTGLVDASWWNSIRTALVTVFGSGANLAISDATLSDPTIDGTPIFTNPVSIANGGTGQTTANAALNAFLPSQTGNASKFLKTDGTDSTWASPGGITIESKTADYTILSSDDVMFVDGSASDFTNTLPDAATFGKFLYIKKSVADTTFNAVNFKRAGSDTIDGGTGSVAVNSIGEGMLMFPISTDWKILGRIIRSAWKSIAITGASSTNTTYTGFYRRVGDTLELSVNIAYSGAPDTGDQGITIPGSLSIASGNLDTTSLKVVGIGMLRYSSDVTITVEYASTTTLRFRTTGGTRVTHSAPTTLGSGNSINFICRVPISGWGA